MSRIERIYIATHRRDMRFTRICVSSIRRWYPDIPIFLLKDYANGSFSTRELEERWNVRSWDAGTAPFGWGFIKLEPLFAADRCRYLMLDSDIIFLGRVIDQLEESSAEFIVQRETQVAADIPALYFDAGALRKTVDPHFTDIPFTFNTGQYVATAGLLTRDDFASVLEWSNPRRVKHPLVFNPSDQGILNYVILLKLATGAITVDRMPFMRWGKEEIAEFDAHLLNEESPYPYLIHWAGLKSRRQSRMLRADLLKHFESAYYERIPYGPAVYSSRLLRDEYDHWRQRAMRLPAKFSSTMRRAVGRTFE